MNSPYEEMELHETLFDVGHLPIKMREMIDEKNERIHSHDYGNETYFPFMDELKEDEVAEVQTMHQAIIDHILYW